MRGGSEWSETLIMAQFQLFQPLALSPSTAVFHLSNFFVFNLSNLFILFIVPSTFHINAIKRANENIHINIHSGGRQYEISY